MDLLAEYQRALTAHGYDPDEAQLKVVEVLQRVGRELEERAAAENGWRRLARRHLGNLIGRRINIAPAKGAYLWGGVGRGKTFVMDLFFESLPFEDKLRFHFHRMMYRVHRDLRKLKNHEDPLEVIAEDIARKARIICFDEFFVADIADAMLLGKLLSALFDRGVTLVATSNTPPVNLYRDGLQRQQFLPAIELIKQHTEVINVLGPTDFRLRVLEQAEIYHSPLDPVATQNLNHYFEQIAPEAGTSGQPIEILGRNIQTVRRADGIAWFDFIEICDGPRSQDDYIEIARSFQTVIISDVPVLDWQREDQARRFIAMVDEFYDRRVNLIISADAPISSLYQGRRLTHEMERTRSRLQEMQSHDYLAAPHRP